MAYLPRHPAIHRGPFVEKNDDERDSGKEIQAYLPHLKVGAVFGTRYGQSSKALWW